MFVKVTVINNSELKRQVIENALDRAEKATTKASERAEEIRAIAIAQEKPLSTQEQINEIYNNTNRYYTAYDRAKAVMMLPSGR